MMPSRAYPFETFGLTQSSYNTAEFLIQRFNKEILGYCAAYGVPGLFCGDAKVLRLDNLDWADRLAIRGASP